MDLQRLINEVQARPAIWDQKNTHYHNRDVILKLWGEIAKACNVSSDVAKSKWKHLRDNFRNELKKTYRGKVYESGSVSPASVAEHESKWVWFRSLQFLRDQMNSRVIGGHLQNGAIQGNLDETQIEPQIDIVEVDEEARFDADVEDESCCDSPMPVSDEIAPQIGQPSKRSGKIGRKRFLPDDNVDFQPNRKRPDPGPFFEEYDDTFHFLMSIRSPLRSLPIDRQMLVRLKIQEIILNEITGHDRSRDNSNVQEPKVRPGRSYRTHYSPERDENSLCST